MKKHFIFSTKNLLIAMAIVLALLGGFVSGLRIGTIDGSRHTTEKRNEMLDLKPYDASLEIKDLEYSNISPAGCTITFNTNKTTGHTIHFEDINGLVCEWGVYPSDVLTIAEVYLIVLGDNALRAKIETFPEGGTVFFRIVDQKTNTGSIWFYIDLPRSEDPNAIMPPPYMQDGYSKNIPAPNEGSE